VAKVAVHITHESAKKIGGIGAVLNGLCSTYAYKNMFEATLLYGPFWQFSPDILPHFGKEGQVLYSSADRYDSRNYGDLFGTVIKDYGVEIVYGKRILTSDFDANKQNTVDVINVNINKMNPHAVTRLKYRLWQQFGLKSELLEKDWDYEQYLRIAVPYVEIVEKLYGAEADFYHFAHEYMGVPAALAVLTAARGHKTIFVAHEVSPARGIVENHGGCDITFYNVLSATKQYSLEQVFGSQEHNPRSELIKRAAKFDRIFAVSDLVREEYLYLCRQCPPEKVRVVYNGLSARGITVQQKEASRYKLDAYIEKLFNFTPDIIFTHVARLVPSKGLWRDFMLLKHLDDTFDRYGLKGAYILVSSLIATGRPYEDTAQMEREYGWPVLHKKGWPDLTGSEEDINNYVQLFNSRSLAIKGVFINQFGFDRASCGMRVPAETAFIDLRIGSDAELGFSIYEPFGIAQLETVPFGGLAILSSSCGCAKYIEKAFDSSKLKPYRIVDFVSAGKGMTVDELGRMDALTRQRLEEQILLESAEAIYSMLPLSHERRREYLENAQQYAPLMSWEDTVLNYFLPNLEK
jgi:glycosyltransferase involved in cell wall biosynthesis